VRGVLAAVFLAILVIAVPVARSGPTSRHDGTSCQRRRRRVARPRITPAQRRQIRRWHTRATPREIDVWLRATPPPLVFRPLSGPHRFELTPDTDAGGFDDADMALASEALASREDGSMHAIHPRLVELTYAAVRHFRAPYAFVISGYRGGRASSRHAQGRALDFVLPGVTDRRLAAWLRTLGFVGVGIYPTSGFVHLDVRGRSYFWSDASGPDQRNRERRILPALGPRYDRAARARGVLPTEELAEAVEVEEESPEIPAADPDAGVASEITTPLDATAPDAGMPAALVDAATP
jgi:hypothetical protein